MTQHQQKQQAKKKQPNSVKQAFAAKPSVTPALPHEPGVSPGSVDVVGIVPADVHVDPEITEGHPGYEETGGSGVRPPMPPSGGKPR